MDQSPEFNPTVFHVDLDSEPEACLSLSVDEKFKAVCQRLGELSTDYTFSAEDLCLAGVNLDVLISYQKRLDDLVAKLGDNPNIPKEKIRRWYSGS